MERRLAAILAADVVGYSRQMGVDEAGTMARLRALRAEVIEAARIEPLAEPGGIAMSARVREDAADKVTLDVEDIGTPELKNIAQPVRVFRVRPTAPERPALALPDKPSLVVLPFQNMSSDPAQEYFADGMVEDITTAPSRIRWLFVIARNSAFAYKGCAVDIRTVGRELGVRYVLEGSVRKSGSRVRITGQLIEAASGHHLWADRFDGDLDDVFALQDRIAESVVGAIEPNLMRLDQGWGSPDDRAIALTLARETIASTTDDAEALGPAGWALAHTAGDYPGAYAALHRALHLHANYAMGLSFLGFAHGMGNDPVPAAGYFERALRLSPLDPDNENRLGGLGVAYLMMGRNEEAVGLLLRATQEMPNSKWIQRHLIHALTRFGRHDDARAAATRLRAIEPEHRVGPPPASFNPEFNEERRQALLNAGIQE